MYRKAILLTAVVSIGFSGLLLVESAAARQNSLIGRLGTGYTYWDRTYDESFEGDVDSGDRRDWGVWPELEFQSLDIHSSLSLSYAPRVTYDELDSETDIDHYLDASWQHQPSRQWSYELSEYFAYSSDPTRYDTVPESGEEEVPQESITENLGRARFWTNNLNFVNTYQYSEGSNIELGYSYRILRNDSDSSEDIQYDEYDRHGLSGLWLHRFSSAWRTQAGLNYYKGLFEDLGEDGLSQDLQEYSARLQADYLKTENNFFPIIYRYQRVEYDDLRDDIWVHELSFNWDYTLDQRSHIILGAGPSYVESENMDGDYDYNFNINYLRTFQRGSFGTQISKGYISHNFSGSLDAGLSSVTELRLDAAYQITSNFEFETFGLYRFEEILNPQGAYLDAADGTGDSVGDVTYERDVYSAGVSVNYSFWRYLAASLAYVYYQQDGNVGFDAYEDHRIVFQLTASRELWR